jgi:hypothetical protein
MSDSAGELYEHMGEGGILRVPHDGSQPTIHIREYKRFNWKDWESYPVDRAVFAELSATGFIHKLTEWGEPPAQERKRYDSYRSGWREMNLNGETADWWVSTQ